MRGIKKKKKIIGITGGISSGKSNVSNIFKKLGYKVIDSDLIYKELSKRPNACYKAILEEFGDEYLDSYLEINRAKLGKLIFTNNEAKLKLNSITHPLVLEEIKKEIDKSDGIIFLDIPLLFEAKMEYLCDKIICVYVPYEIELQRLIERDNISISYAKSKISSQMSLETKKDLSDYVINSSGSFEKTYEQVLKCLDKIKED